MGGSNSDANGHQNTAQLYEIVQLDANATLQVRCGCNSGSLADPLSSRFTLLYLGTQD